MSDVETQLREYFEAAVERVMAEDVLAGQRVSETIHPRRQRWSLHPAWAAVAAFAATVLLLGGSLAVGVAVRQRGRDVGSGGIPEAAGETTATISGWWQLIPVIAVVAAIIVALVVRNHQVRTKKERAMAKTIETSPAVQLEPSERKRNKRYLIIGLVVAVLLAAGLGVWLIAGDGQTADERDITALMDDYGAAWEANDGAAALALMTDDAVLKAGNGLTYSVDRLESAIDSFGPIAFEHIGDRIIMEGSSGPGFSTPGWIVAEASLIDYAGGSDHVLDLFKIVEQDGRLLIAYHETWRGGE